MGEEKARTTYEYTVAGTLNQKLSIFHRTFPTDTTLLMVKHIEQYQVKAYILPSQTRCFHLGRNHSGSYVVNDTSIFSTLEPFTPNTSQATGVIEINPPNGNHEVQYTLYDYTYFNSTITTFVGYNCTLGVGVFSHCKQLETVKLFLTDDNIPNETFLNCTSLKTVVVNGTTLNVSEIGKRAFQGCSALQIEFAGRNTIINEMAFRSCNRVILDIPRQVILRDKALSRCRAMVIVHKATPIQQLKSCHSIIRYTKQYESSVDDFSGLCIDIHNDCTERWTWYFHNAGIDINLFKLYKLAKEHKVTNFRQYDENILRGLFRREIQQFRTDGTLEIPQSIFTYLGEDTTLTILDPLRPVTIFSYNKTLFSILSYELKSNNDLKANERYRFFGESIALCYRASTVNKGGKVHIHAYTCISPLKSPLNLLHADCWRNQLYAHTSTASMPEFENKLFDYCKSKGLDGWHMRVYTDNTNNLAEAEYEIAIAKDKIFKKYKFRNILSTKINESNIMDIQRKLLKSNFVKLRI